MMFKHAQTYLIWIHRWSRRGLLALRLTRASSRNIWLHKFLLSSCWKRGTPISTIDTQHIGPFFPSHSKREATLKLGPKTITLSFHSHCWLYSRPTVKVNINKSIRLHFIRDLTIWLHKSWHWDKSDMKPGTAFPHPATWTKILITYLSSVSVNICCDLPSLCSHPVDKLVK